MALEQDALALWQSLLDRQDRYFGRIKGGRIGIVERATFASPPGAVLVWDIAGGRARAGADRYRCPGGYDLLLVVPDGARWADPGRLAPDPVAALRRLIRRGEVLFFVPAGRDELRARGFEDLVEALGVPFLGTCH
ncbi:MAG: hypothetical protein M0Z41_12880 [Peptococcaceae bacterium]|jgi:hypothetical protein|nr:hypothetical protein [Peptococcaceae bacterium]